MPRLLLAVLFIVLAALPAQAQAHKDGPTELESIWIADRWAAKDAPTLANHCANGARTITRSNAAIDALGGGVLGFADGWVRRNDYHTWDGKAWTYHGWDEWNHAKCTWTTRENLTPEHQCAIDAHEQMHYVIGPQHEGPLDPMHPGPVECFTHNDSVPATTVRKRARRTQAQINRSIRHRRAKARAAARAAMRRMHAN